MPGQDPCIRPKAIKNAVEIKGAHAAHLRDGVAMARFLAWLDEVAESGKIDEVAAAMKLEDCRRESGQLKDISFDTISAAGPNGAIVHYRPTTKGKRALQAGTLYLIDSGAQYRDGTTDVTRTVAIGTPTAEMRRHYGLVLKAHIAIATARFPKGTRGQDLDPFARRPLWEAGLDFDHGTGHGVGSYLSVHEGPQRLSRLGTVELEPGMILSNEPGYYREGHYGIRLENLVLVTPPERIPGGTREMMGFETLTLVPFDRRLIDPEAAPAVGARLAQRLSRARQAGDRADAPQRRPGLAPPRHRADRVEWRSRFSFRAVAATLTTAAFVPQALHIIRHKETRAISLHMYVAFATGVLFWLLFGVMIGNLPIIVSNAITLGLALAIIGMKLNYG